MDEAKTRVRNERQDQAEANVLSRIVDAMLAVESDLQGTTIEDWSRKLLDSCRQQKQGVAAGCAAMASSC